MDNVVEQDLSRWKYCAKDCMYTFEIHKVLQKILGEQPKILQDFYRFRVAEVAPVLDRMMNKGVRIDKEEKAKLYTLFHTLLLEVEQELKDLVGEDWNVNSIPQKKRVFKDLLGISLVTKKQQETTDASAMREYIELYPLYVPFLTLLLEYQSLKVFVNTFLGMELDTDGRARSQYKQFHTDTYRLSSTKNVYGKACNFQNIPEKGKIDLLYCTKIYQRKSTTSTNLELPNCKKIFIPDEGYTFFNVDYKGADAQVVAYDSNCQFLIDIFKDPTADLYSVIASEYYGRKITKNTPERTKFKAVCHATNYKGGATTIARVAGLLVHEVDLVQKWYFERCPELIRWQNSIVNDIKTKGYTSNIFGARGYYINTNDPTLVNKAIGWRGQSVIAILCNHALVSMDKLDKIDVLMQTHDSVAGQFITTLRHAPRLIRKAMLLELPYDTPLTIDVDFDIYTEGYGSSKLYDHNFIM